ncbi:ECF-type sigma factor [Chitinimonas sp.]|uniref:ECF-type sigma factor n=1 Tax=Chitinimonas sp. TaxID=1934313 RepID=UPI0035B34720
MPDITGLLEKIESGEPGARDSLYQQVYRELTRLARSHLSRCGTISLNASHLVHEAYLRLSGQHGRGRFANRKLFFAYVSSVMRSVLIDYVRERQAQKRGGDVLLVTLDADAVADLISHGKIEALDDALNALGRVNARCLQLVEMRYFAGLSEAETAAVLDVSVATVQREWRKARAFLLAQIKGGA